MVFNTLLGTLRWKVLLETQGVDLSFKRVLELSLVGSFFNIALPGAVSGDFIKAVYVTKQVKNKRGAIFGSMLFDRILGVSAMVFVAAFSAFLSTLLPWGGALPNALLLSIGAVGLAVVGFYIYLFTSHAKDPLLAVVQFFTHRMPKLMVLQHLYTGVMSYRAFPRRVLKAILLSVAIHSLLVLIAFLLTENTSTTPIPFIALAVTVPIGMLATSVPILPAGVGTGHAAFYALYKMVGSDQGAQVFSLIVLYQVLVGIVGGLVFFKVSAEQHRADALSARSAIPFAQK